MNIRIPEPLTLEHQELHEELVRATKASGRTAEAAKAVAAILHPHFVKEEEYALPPLGLLSALATGPVTPAMRNALTMTRRLETDLPHMLDEHKAIVAALETLKEAAHREGHPQYIRFAEKLTLHAKTEEEVLYPAAILIGRFLERK